MCCESCTRGWDNGGPGEDPRDTVRD
jgi:hypothetical protein